MAASERNSDEMNDDEASVDILARLDQLIQNHPEFGLEDSSFDCDNTDGSLCFRFAGRDWIISSQDIEVNG